MDRKTTIYDIARLAGTSTSTVSAALSGAWQTRRIKAETALAIQRIAAQHGFRANMQARALRNARSGLAGMILPLHDNRFFAALSQAFDAQARARGLCPVVVSTLRDPEEERRTVETLISHAVEIVFVAGATDPATVNALLRDAGLRQVNIDLPSTSAPSVVTDNYRGARTLTGALIDRLPPGEAPFFIGGRQDDEATRLRAEAFGDALAARLDRPPAGRIVANGYAPQAVARDLAGLIEQEGRMPRGLFVNSTIALEGVLYVLATLPRDELRDTIIACYDYDPTAAFLFVPVIMMRQNADGLVATAFDLLDREALPGTLIYVEPELVEPGTFPAHLLREFG